MTPLHCAASQGSLAVANCLVEAGADLRSLDEEQMTPLHFACMEGNLEVAKLLLDTGGSRVGTCARVWLVNLCLPLGIVVHS